MITPLPCAIELKSRFRHLVLFCGVQPALVDNEGHPQEGATEVIPGHHRFAASAHSVRRSANAFEQTAFSTFKNMYFSGDGARQNDEDAYWITGRVDDVLTFRHRLKYGGMSAARIRRSPKRRWWVFHTLSWATSDLRLCDAQPRRGAVARTVRGVRNWVRKQIGPLATPDVLH